MEGSKAVKRKRSRTTVPAIIIIVAVHVVGILGFNLKEMKPLFLQLVPWYLLFMLAILSVCHKTRMNLRYIVFFLAVYILGFAVEWVGIHTGWLFGVYTYGKTLGIKLADVPLTIGINWFLLVYATGATMKRSKIRDKRTRVLGGAGVLALLDIFIEPIAIRSDYWRWTDNNIVPVTNYITWFFVSAAMLYLFELFEFRKQNVIAPLFLGMQFLFFAIFLLL